VGSEDERAKLGWRSRRVRAKVFYTALLLATACYIFFTSVLWPVKILGDSMMPSYRNGSRHFVNKVAYWSATPQRGDVVGLRAPDGDILIKRIVGLPGEAVGFKEGRITINGAVLREPFIDTRVPFTNQLAAVLGPDDYYIIGDNRGVSVLGAVSSRHIIGKIVF
jgi:signal peptidase I